MSVPSAEEKTISVQSVILRAVFEIQINTFTKNFTFLPIVFSRDSDEISKKEKKRVKKEKKAKKKAKKEAKLRKESIDNDPISQNLQKQIKEQERLAREEDEDSDSRRDTSDRKKDKNDDSVEMRDSPKREIVR